jgi:hypothetical protein
MNGRPIEQRCWNHDAREAVCRCPGCSRSFCRECVTEHEARLLCAACLNSFASNRRQPSGKLRWLVPAGMLLAGFFLAWTLFYGSGVALNLFAGRMGQSAWPAH